jgi:hypothetical protein
MKQPLRVAESRRSRVSNAYLDESSEEFYPFPPPGSGGSWAPLRLTTEIASRAGLGSIVRIPTDSV